jgi:hypothetical protein
MKNLFLSSFGSLATLTCLLSFGLPYSSNCQQKAVTETGREVLLFDDNTWRYLDENPSEESEIKLNDKKYTKPSVATFLLKSNKVKMGIWLDPKAWSFKKATNNEDAEFEFQYKNGDLYGMLIAERLEIPIETLRKIAIENGQAAAPDLQIVKEEYRQVNGITVLLLQLNGTMQGIKFSYFGYYFSNTSGSVQFVTYTAQNLLNDYIQKCEELLNGLVEIK